jgi:hypothetical protein
MSQQHLSKLSHEIPNKLNSKKNLFLCFLAVQSLFFGSQYVTVFSLPHRLNSNFLQRVDKERKGFLRKNIARHKGENQHAYI